jgi:hypothetical protein
MGDVTVHRGCENTIWPEQRINRTSEDTRLHEVLRKNLFKQRKITASIRGQRAGNHLSRVVVGAVEVVQFRPLWRAIWWAAAVGEGAAVVVDQSNRAMAVPTPAMPPAPVSINVDYSP